MPCIFSRLMQLIRSPAFVPSYLQNHKEKLEPWAIKVAHRKSQDDPKRIPSRHLQQWVNHSQIIRRQFSPSQLLQGAVLEEHTSDRHLGRFPPVSIHFCLLLGRKRMLQGLPGSEKVICFHQLPMKPPHGSKRWPISEGFRLCFSQAIRPFFEPRTMARRPLASSEFSFLATRWVPRWKTLTTGFSKTSCFWLHSFQQTSS